MRDARYLLRHLRRGDAAGGTKAHDLVGGQRSGAQTAFLTAAVQERHEPEPWLASHA